ncbi:hypothetical protein IJ670_00195 [bacterium]|nr:hypothetical protein [bacterium]
MSEKKKKTPFCPISMACNGDAKICMQENCAWWMSSTKTCVAYVIAHNNILEIKQKQAKK